MTTLSTLPRRFRRLLLTATAGCALIACGGGGGGDGGGDGGTAPLAWGQSQALLAGVVSTETPHVDFLAGNGQAVWIQQTSNGPKVASRRYSAGAWQGETVILSRNGTEAAASGARVARLSNGESVAVWEESTVAPGNQSARVMAASTLNQVWGEPAPLAAFAVNVSAGALDVVAGGAGVAMVVWNTVPFGVAHTPEVHAAAFRDGAFQPAEKLNTSAEEAGSPSIAVDAQGRALAAWLQTNAQGVRRVVVRAHADGNWTPPDDLAPANALSAALPVATLGTNGRATVAWRQQLNATTQAPQVASTNDFLSNDWSQPSALSETAGSQLINIAATQDPLGTTTVVWTQRDDAVANPQGPLSVWAARVGANVSPAQKISTAPAGSSAVGSDAYGRAMALWLQEEVSANTSRPHARAYDPASGQWGVIDVISTGSAAPSDQTARPALSVSADGTALAVWIQNSAQALTSIVVNAYQ